LAQGEHGDGDGNVDKEDRLYAKDVAVEGNPNDL
jgi:hypothetical protein